MLSPKAVAAVMRLRCRTALFLPDPPLFLSFYLLLPGPEIRYAKDEEKFFRDFAAAFSKLLELGEWPMGWVQTRGRGTKGCRRFWWRHWLAGPGG